MSSNSSEKGEIEVEEEEENEDPIKLPSAKLASVTRKINEIKNCILNALINDKDESLQVTIDKIELDRRIDVLNRACMELSQKVDEEGKKKIEKWKNDKLEMLSEVFEQITSYVNRFDAQLKQQDNKSIESDKNSKENEIYIEYLTRKKDLKVTAEKLKEREEDMKVEKEKLKEEENYVKFLENSLKDLTLNKEQDYERVDKSTVFESTNIVNESVLEILKRQEAFNKYVMQNTINNNLPVYEPEKFTGNITAYSEFILSFQTNIENKCSSETDKYYYLLKYTSGLANDIVKSCLHLKDGAFKAAKELLNKEFGNEFKVAEAYITKLENFSDIKTEDKVTMKELYIFLNSCNNVMKNISILNQLNNHSEILKVVKKLPYKLREKWRLKANSIQEHYYVLPNFNDLVNFVKVESDLLNVPIYGDIGYVPSKSNFAQKASNQNVNKSKSFFVNNTENQNKPTQYNTNNENKVNNNNNNFNNNNNENSNIRTFYCHFCNKNGHKINYCREFGKLMHNDKVDYIKKNRLCFRCLRDNHLSNACKRAEICSICNKYHLTILHLENKPQIVKKNESQNSFTTKMADVNTNSPSTNNRNTVKNEQANFHTNVENKEKLLYPAVPVKIKIKGDNKYIETYMGLDTYSSACFMDLELAKKLGINIQSKKEVDITTMNGNDKITTFVLNNLEVYDLDMNNKSILHTIYCKDKWPFTEKDSPTEKEIENLDYLKGVPFKFIKAKIGLLIGVNHNELLKPLKVIEGPYNKPFAVKYSLGWAIQGITPEGIPAFMNLRCHKTKIENKEEINVLEKYCMREFIDKNPEQVSYSQDDLKWIEKVDKTLEKTVNGKFQVCLPFRKENPNFPNNKYQVLSRLNSLKKKFIKDTEYYTEYKKFINEMLESKYAEKINENEINNSNKFYLSHHSVLHPQKQTLRVVFNASLPYKGVSLNNSLLQGPDFLSNLQGILLRFRENKYAFIADIKKMFYQIHVIPEHKDYLRFFWFPNDDLNKEPEEYRVTVHIFGSNSSPSIANYVLKKATNIKEVEKYSKEAKMAIQRNFYMDDILRSSETEDSVINLYKEILQISGFKLHKVISNSKKFNESLDKEDKEISKNVKDINLSLEKVSNEKVLGLNWNLENDVINARVEIEQKDLTKRGILSNIFSIYDPIGIIQPVILPAKRMFQTLCDKKISWDAEIPTDIKEIYKKWIDNIHKANEFKIPRAYNPNCIKYNHIELHFFADGSQNAYAAVAYIRYVGVNNEIHCSLVMSKSRLVPLNKSLLLTIPRIELCAAKLAVTIQQILQRELDIKIYKEYFWIDSQIVLQYIKNESKRFKRFVFNRVSYMREHTNKDNWNYVPSKLNIADIASKCTIITEFMNNEEIIKVKPIMAVILNKKLPTDKLLNDSVWFKLRIKIQDTQINIDNNINTNKDITKEKPIMAVILNEKLPTDKLLDGSDWFKLRIKIAWILRIKNCLHNKKWIKGPLSISEIKEAEIAIFKYIQYTEFKDIKDKLRKQEKLTKRNPLTSLMPFIDNKVIMRVDEINKSLKFLVNIKHLFILSHKYYIPVQLIRSVIRSDKGINFDNGNKKIMNKGNKHKKSSIFSIQIKWTKEYLPLLYKRSKWITEKESLKEGDLVLLIEDMKPRNLWSLGRIQKVYQDNKGKVRIVDVKINKTKDGLETTVLKRPITKLILLKKRVDLE